MCIVRQRLLERLDVLARRLQRQVGREQVLGRLLRDEVAERVVEAAALADGRTYEAGLHPVAQARLLDSKDPGDIANRIQLDHGALRWASTFRDNSSSGPRARLSTSPCALVRSQRADFLASATAMRRAYSRQRSSAASRKAPRWAVEASGGSETFSRVRARSTVSIVEAAKLSPSSPPSLSTRAASWRISTA